jgi:hypothetical protein
VSTGTRTLLDTCRRISSEGSVLPQLIFPSSLATFGSQREVSDDTKFKPEVGSLW